MGTLTVVVTDENEKYIRTGVHLVIECKLFSFQYVPGSKESNFRDSWVQTVYPHSVLDQVGIALR